MKKSNKIIAYIVVAILALGAVVYNCGCPHDWHTKTPLEKLDYSVDEAEKTVKNFNENLIPEIEKQLKTICEIQPPPEWCKETEKPMKDLKDAMAALEVVLGEAKKALELADGTADPSTIAVNISVALIRLSGAYIKVQAIINRHQ